MVLVALSRWSRSSATVAARCVYAAARSSTTVAAPAAAPKVTAADFLPDRVEEVDTPEWLRGEDKLERQFLQGHEQLRLTYFRGVEKDGNGQHALHGRAFFGKDGCEGPPGHAHGGSMAAVLDEAMGTVCWDNGFQVLAGEIAVRFHAPLPLNRDTRVLAEITAVEGRKVRVSASLAALAEGGGQTAAAGSDDQRPAVYTTATGTFINMNEKFVKYLEELAKTS